MVAVSVVIPVYNVEDYLKECLDSIISQTFKDIEIICINDGSTDDSLNILEQYADFDNRIKIFSQENQGLSASRNRGIKLSQGEYIYFMDSDDILEPNALEELYDLSKMEDLDIVIFKLINFNDETGEKYTRKYYEMPFLKPFNRKVFDYRDLGDNALKVAVSAPGKLFKRDLICDIQFPEGLIFEDNPFFAQAMLKAKRVSFIDKYFYNRRVREDSITTTKTIKFADTLPIVNKVMELFKDENVYDDFKKPLIETKIRFAYLRFASVGEEYKEEFFQRIKADFTNFKEEFENDDVFKYKIGDIQRNRFKAVFYSSDYKEYELNTNLYYYQEMNKVFKRRQKKYKKELKYYSDKNKEILSSKSWKMTEPLRKVVGDTSFQEDSMFFESLIEENKKESDDFKSSQISRDMSVDMSDDYLRLKELEEEHRKLDEQNKILKERIKLEKKRYEDLSSSASWKLTEHFRKLNGYFS